MGSRHRRWPALLAATAMVIAVAACSSSGDSRPAPVAGRIVPSEWDWPTYGHDAQHTFHGRTTLTAASVRDLKPAWTFPTGDAVTVTPTVVGGVVYAGSWDGWFYAVGLRNGRLRWKFHLDPQPAVSPQPGEEPRDFSSDGGMVTSSAWFEPATKDHPNLVIFGGGYTLYALDARTGKLFWKHAYTGRPDRPPKPADDDTRIFSSPVVVDGKVIVGVAPDGHRGYRGYVVAASLADGSPVWTYETDAGVDGRVANDGCGGVWSSATVLPEAGWVVLDLSDCHFENPPPLSESVFALRIRDGRLAWRFRPGRHDHQCDWDFGATANAALDADGRAKFLGVGGKDGTYYSLDPRTGGERWSTNVVFGGFSGGFIATTAYDGHAVYGSTALGDFGRFEGVGMKHCDQGNPADQEMQNPAVHSFDAATGKVRYQANDDRSFSPTTVAGGMTFNGLALSKAVVVRRADNGAVLKRIEPLDAPCWSGIATAGDALVFGTGASQQGKPDGIVAYTPGGRLPVASGSGSAGS